MPPRKNPKKDPVLSFETAIEKVETIVTQMEEEQLPLEELIKHYETANSLLKHCQNVLSTAHKKIERITLSTDQGEIDAAASQTSASSETDDTDDDHDPSLFR